MNAGYRKLAGSQHGSFYSTALVVVLFALVLTAALKIAPTYMNNAVLVNAMESMVAENDFSEMSVSQIRTRLMRTLNTNNVDISSDAVQLVKEGGNEYIDVNYEARVKLFYNISAVVSFDNRFEK